MCKPFHTRMIQSSRLFFFVSSDFTKNRYHLSKLLFCTISAKGCFTLLSAIQHFRLLESMCIDQYSLCEKKNHCNHHMRHLENVSTLRLNVLLLSFTFVTGTLMLNARRENRHKEVILPKYISRECFSEAMTSEGSDDIFSPRLVRSCKITA